MRLATSVIAACLLVGVSYASASVRRQGYIPTTDGTQLEYTVDLPAAEGRFPVILVYDGYCEGTGATNCNDAATATELVSRGYAALGVSIRGTSCSTGTFDAFTEAEFRDGAEAIEWAAKQDWSDGHLGMLGDSFPGITQLGVAGLRPPHLDAIAPFQVTADPYRDVGYPGGIQNTGFGAFWASADQPQNSYRSGVQQAVATQDAGCAQALAVHASAEPTQNIALQAPLHPYDDAWWQSRRPGANAANIDVPTFACTSWQDDEVSSRAYDWTNALDPKRTWVLDTNGYHGMCDLSSPRITAQLIAFFDRFVRGEKNGFEETPHVQLWHDAHVESGSNVPSWVTSFDSYATMPVRPLSLWFQPDGSLALTRPRGEAPPARYAYPASSPGNEDGVVFGQNNLLWQGPQPQAASVSYTTPPLADDAEFFGSGSADVWLSSTAPDTDLQITLTEVRPDGQEVYVARGWLRASHRALDPKRSTALAPFHTDREADARSLPQGGPTRMRVQLWPFDYVFRRGSSIRLWIDAPMGETGGWSLDFTKVPAINSVYADGAHRSALVLGHLEGGRAGAPLPACNTLLNQPCRPNPAAVPDGMLTIPAAQG